MLNTFDEVGIFTEHSEDSEENSGRQADLSADVVPTQSALLFSEERDGAVNRDWIKVYRKLKDWEWYKTDHMVRIFLHIILSANHRLGKWQGVDIFPGQWVTGRKTLSNETGISEQSCRTCIKRLISTGEITIKSTNRFSVITVVNWSHYNGDRHESTSNSTIQLTNNQPATNQQLTTNKNEKKEKKKNTKVSDSSSDNNHIPYRGIIDFLNEKTGKEYRHSSKGTQRLIKARWNEGFRLKDFLEVIQGRVDKWGCDPKMMDYLRPETLFGTKFESYLNAD